MYGKIADSGPSDPGYTHQEIFQQPLLWATTINLFQDAPEVPNLSKNLAGCRVLLTGAGSSSFAASSIVAAWRGAVAVPSTDLLVDASRYLDNVDAVISVARSGNSPESVAVVRRIRAIRPDLLQLAITCNGVGALAQSAVDRVILLDPRTNDQSLVMTSSFSNLVLAGFCMAETPHLSSTAHQAIASANTLLPIVEEICRSISARVTDRIVVLASSPFRGWLAEAGLKALEMTAGRFPVINETYLGLRHGPLSFLRPDTLVVCLLSNDLSRRKYEVDLILELRSKRLGYLVGIGALNEYSDLFDVTIPAIAPNAPDELRTPFEIVIPQLLGYHLSLSIGINPDNPSPDGVINRVVRSFTIYHAASRPMSVG